MLIIPLEFAGLGVERDGRIAEEVGGGGARYVVNVAVVPPQARIKFSSMPRFSAGLISANAFSAASERARAHADVSPEDAAALRQRVQERALDLLEEWGHTATERQNVGRQLEYQTETRRGDRLLYEFLSPELKQQPARRKKFRANRSMRDVEPSVNLWLKTIDGVDIEEEQP